MLTAKDSALVPGNVGPTTGGKMIKKEKVEVIRPFFYNRERMEVGSVVEVSSIFARELVSNNKAVMTNKDVKTVAPAKPDPLKPGELPGRPVDPVSQEDKGKGKK